MSRTDQHIRDSLRAARDQMVLHHEDDASIQSIRQRAEATPVRRAHRRWALPAGIAAAVLGVGASVAVAVTVTNDGSRDAFRHVHPNKADVSAINEQPHALLGNVPIAGGGEIRAYATTPGGRAGCVLVEQLTPAGAQVDSVAYCGEEPAAHADLRLVNGALIGWVPDPLVTSVQVSGAGHDRAAPVVAQHFMVAAAVSDARGTTETITGRNAGAHIVSVWSVKIR